VSLLMCPLCVRSALAIRTTKAQTAPAGRGRLFWELRIGGGRFAACEFAVEVGRGDGAQPEPAACDPEEVAPDGAPLGRTEHCANQSMLATPAVTAA
jgi:hypothetical protein